MSPLYNDGLKGLYLYYSTEATIAVSVFSNGVVASTALISAAAGAGICGLVTALVRKKKQEQAA